MHLEIDPTEATVLRNFLRERLSERLSKETGDMLHRIYLQLTGGQEHPTWVSRYPKKEEE